ncbi:sugar transferase [Prosthecochloris sp. CIB 2401]|uniref:sugar transferase n=1 Tax=Prosthecochloris sp. CIB 2401 TaxID=1868325 RepID=UPI00080A9FB0|nr:sugar transferase [Prosthecochloris sp. CIB 2401]ANT64900.1 putative sugar transferase EpsL [Prosthecochloris sp. CIB 2401]
MELDPLVRKELIRQVSGTVTPKARFRPKMKIYVWEKTVAFSYTLKRSTDIIASLVIMVLLSPLFLLTALAIWIETPAPVLYSQVRVGRNGKHFRFYKFRSMLPDADKIKSQLADQNESADGVIFKMKKDPRITKVGSILRKLSIDELPQLFNVLKGDMSLVGPRPPLPDEVAEYTLEDRKRLHVIPGITGLWQVSGRSDIPFEAQVKLDMEYIKSASFFNDIRLLLKTIPAVLTGKGAY